MSTMVENFEKILVEKNIPIDKIELSDTLVLYQWHQQLTSTQASRLEIIVPKQSVGDVQITYRYVGQLNDYAKKNDMLEVVNELNEMQTGYYTLFLAGDGELYLKLLTRSNENMDQVYEMLITGMHTAIDILPRIESVAGAYINL